MTLENWYYLLNIFAPIITAIGILASFYISIKTLKEVKRDRVLAQKPYLIFEHGGFCDNVVFVHAGRNSPGFNRNVIAEILEDIPEDAISIRRELIKEGKIAPLRQLRTRRMADTIKPKERVKYERKAETLRCGFQERNRTDIP